MYHQPFSRKGFPLQNHYLLREVRRVTSLSLAQGYSMSISKIKIDPNGLKLPTDHGCAGARPKQGTINTVYMFFKLDGSFYLNSCCEFSPAMFECVEKPGIECASQACIIGVMILVSSCKLKTSCFSIFPQAIFCPIHPMSGLKHAQTASSQIKNTFRTTFGTCSARLGKH